jgi:hypothetical protein
VGPFLLFSRRALKGNQELLSATLPIHIYDLFNISNTQEWWWWSPPVLSVFVPVLCRLRSWGERIFIPPFADSSSQAARTVKKTSNICLAYLISLRWKYFFSLLPICVACASYSLYHSSVSPSVSHSISLKPQSSSGGSWKSPSKKKSLQVSK